MRRLTEEVEFTAGMDVMLMRRELDLEVGPRNGLVHRRRCLGDDRSRRQKRAPDAACVS